jgi:hypothetical protein
MIISFSIWHEFIQQFFTLLASAAMRNVQCGCDLVDCVAKASGLTNHLMSALPACNTSTIDKMSLTTFADYRLAHGNKSTVRLVGKV